MTIRLSSEIVAANQGSEPIVWHTGAPKPFGIRVADGPVLWPDASEEGAVVEDREVVGGGDGDVATDPDPGEAVAEAYEVRSDRDTSEPGEFTLDGERAYRFEGGRGTVPDELRGENRALDVDR